MSERYMALHFGMGKAYEDIGEYEKAFDHFQMGATLKRAKLKYDEAETFAFFDAIRNTFNAEFFANPPFEGTNLRHAGFHHWHAALGLDARGADLSSHPDVFGAGEIKEFSRRLNGLRSRFPGLPKYPQIALKMNQAHYKIVAEGYLSTVKGFFADSRSRHGQAADKLLFRWHASCDVSKRQVHPYQAQSCRYLLVCL